jgi:hypothetical protein
VNHPISDWNAINKEKLIAHSVGISDYTYKINAKKKFMFNFMIEVCESFYTWR